MGHVLTWSGERIFAAIEDVAANDLVEVDGVGEALVLALHADRVELAPFAAIEPAPDAAVTRIGPCTAFRRGPTLLSPAHPARLTTGFLNFDLQRVMLLGTSILAGGPSVFARRLLDHQARLGRKTIAIELEGATAVRRWLAPWYALATAHDLRAAGHDVVVVFPDLSGWHALVEQFPDRGGWPTQLAALSSLAYALPTGSVSLVACGPLRPEDAACFDTTLDLELVARAELERTGTKLVRPPITVPSRGRLGGAVVDLVRDKSSRFRAVLELPTTDSAEQLACLLVLTDTPIRDLDRFLAAAEPILAGVRAAGQFTAADVTALARLASA